SGVLADRPRPAPVHVSVRPARERELARRLELEPGDVRGGVDRLDLDARIGLAPVGGRCHQAEGWSSVRGRGATAYAFESAPAGRGTPAAARAPAPAGGSRPRRARSSGAR